MRRDLIQALPWLSLAALGLFAKCTYDGRRRAEGREAVEIQKREAVEDSLRQRTLPRVDSVYVRDTLTLWRRVTTTQTLLDTLRLSDTVTLTKRESVLVFVAESLVVSCRSAVLSCEARVSARDSLISTVTLDRDYWRRKSSPSLLTQLSTAGKWLAIGFVIGAVR